MRGALLTAVAVALVGAPDARANMVSNDFGAVIRPPKSQPKPEPEFDARPLVVGAATTVGVGLAGFWLLTRRTKPPG